MAAKIQSALIRSGSAPVRSTATDHGYYRYGAGHLPELPGLPRYEGRVVHPQKWPRDLDPADKRVLVIGSGATAVTLVPAMAERAAQVTMLQRSPGYVLSIPRRDALAGTLRRRLGPERGYVWARRKNILLQMGLYAFCRRFPDLARRLIRRLAVEPLPHGYPVDTHFEPVTLDGVPNLAFLIGYTNASWTLKVGLVCEHLCRLLSRMDELGADTCAAELPYPNMPTRPLLGFKAGYVQRLPARAPAAGDARALEAPGELPRRRAGVARPGRAPQPLLLAGERGRAGRSGSDGPLRSVGAP